MKYTRDGDHKKAKRRLHNRVTTPEEDRRIIEYLQNNPSATSRAIVDDLNLTATSSTIRRRLIKDDLRNQVIAAKETLNPRYINSGLQFALDHQQPGLML